MSAQDKIEKILRNLHILLSKSEPYTKEPGKVIVEKQTMLDLLQQLNEAMETVMDTYELTKQSRDCAERDFKKRGDEIIKNANRNAEDIYAASILYTDEALNNIQKIIKDTDASVELLYKEMNQKLKKEQKRIKSNQLELKSQLNDLKDTDKYLKLIQERNKEIEKQKEKEKPIEERKTNIYANRQTEIKIHSEYFEKMGVPLEEAEPENTEVKKDVEADIKIDLDADYFQWKEEQETKNKAFQEKTDRFQKILKGLTSGKNEF